LSTRYDVLNRPLAVTRPISSTNTNLQSTTYGYSGRTRTVKDPYSHVTTMITDVNGRLRQTKDPIGYNVTRAYDAAGSLTGVTDSVGNTLLKNVTYNYGIKPFLVAATDADRGAWTYEVDSLGERTSWKDAKGQSFSMSYDALSRPFTLGYNSTTGLLNTLTYPISTSGFALNIQYGYQYGLLQSVTDTTDTTSTCGTTCTLWTANAMNGFGQITQETLGNGVVLKRTYDPVTSWLTAATGGVGGGAGMVNQSYLQDENGNVIQRQANNLGLTESYSYDADNRLTCVTLTDSGCSTPTFVYDAGVAGPGNITSQAGVGTYMYPAPGQIQPHAVSSITGALNGISNPSFTYDGNGNMTGRAASANIAWSSYNYPTAISASDATGSEEVQLFYGPDRQRWEQIYTVPGTTEQTYYIGGLIDLVFRSGATNFRHYIYAGKEPVAVYSRTAAGVNTMSYILGDSRGSVTVLASDTGGSDIGESYTAFGVRRNPNTWSGAPATADLNTIAGISRQGFTFQTALGQPMGLNHMNGRVQDAILGRFLSPDPSLLARSQGAKSVRCGKYCESSIITLLEAIEWPHLVNSSS
jgi:YD repeat-containing protein